MALHSSNTQVTFLKTTNYFKMYSSQKVYLLLLFHILTLQTKKYIKLNCIQSDGQHIHCVQDWYNI